MKQWASRTALLLAAAVVGGCMVHRAPSWPASQGTSQLPEDALDVHLRALAAQLLTEGVKPAGLRERGFLPPSGRAAFPFHIAASECAIFIAIATASMADLDASLYTADGAPLIEDDSTGARPTLTFCASPRGPVDGYLTLHAYQGAGSFVAEQFRRAPRPDDDLHTAASDSAGASLLGQLAQTLHERGFEDVSPRVPVQLGGGPVRLAVHVLAGECYTFAAEAGAGLSKLALRLLDADGAELATGVGEPSLAALQYCSAQPAELSLELSAQGGQGVVHVGRFRGTEARTGGARALWLGEPSPSPAAWAAAKSSAPSSGLQPFLTQQFSLRQGEMIELMPKAVHGACEVWQLALVPGLSRASVRIENDRGELLGEADSEHMRACVMVCDTVGVHRVSLLGRAGFGAVTLTGSSVRAGSGAGASDRAGLVFVPPSCHGSSARSELSTQPGR
ncbi:MAG: hypothetical protein JWN04_3918 [Myxococcaceae bacterium]|nr:hypothetical protein [Myxococcaceae bacterium]